MVVTETPMSTVETTVETVDYESGIIGAGEVTWTALTVTTPTPPEQWKKDCAIETVSSEFDPLDELEATPAGWTSPVPNGTTTNPWDSPPSSSIVTGGDVANNVDYPLSSGYITPQGTHRRDFTKSFSSNDGPKVIDFGGTGVAADGTAILTPSPPSIAGIKTLSSTTIKSSNGGVYQGAPAYGGIPLPHLPDLYATDGGECTGSLYDRPTDNPYALKPPPAQSSSTTSKTKRVSEETSNVKVSKRKVSAHTDTSKKEKEEQKSTKQDLHTSFVYGEWIRQMFQVGLLSGPFAVAAFLTYVSTAVFLTDLPTMPVIMDGSPGEKDIIRGKRGPGHFRKQVCQEMLAFVRSLVPIYIEIKSQTEKSEFLTLLAQFLLRRGIRFVKEIVVGTWYVLPINDSWLLNGKWYSTRKKGGVLVTGMRTILAQILRDANPAHLARKAMMLAMKKEAKQAAKEAAARGQAFPAADAANVFNAIGNPLAPSPVPLSMEFEGGSSTSAAATTTTTTTITSLTNEPNVDDPLAITNFDPLPSDSEDSDLDSLDGFDEFLDTVDWETLEIIRSMTQEE